MSSQSEMLRLKLWYLTRIRPWNERKAGSYVNTVFFVE